MSDQCEGRTSNDPSRTVDGASLSAARRPYVDRGRVRTGGRPSGRDRLRRGPNLQQVIGPVACPPARRCRGAALSPARRRDRGGADRGARELPDQLGIPRPEAQTSLDRGPRGRIGQGQRAGTGRRRTTPGCPHHELRARRVGKDLGGDHGGLCNPTAWVDASPAGADRRSGHGPRSPFRAPPVDHRRRR